MYRLISIFLFVISVAGFAQTKLEVVLQQGHSAAVKAIAASNDGRFIATGSRDKSAKIWDANTGAEIRSFLGHEHTVNGVKFSNDGVFLATSSADNTAKIWNLKTGKEVFSTPVYEKYMTDIAFSTDSKFLIVAGYSDSVGIYEISTKNLVKKIAVNADQGSGYGTNLAFSYDGKWLAVGEDNRTAIIYSTNNWEQKYLFKPQSGWCGGCGTLVCFSTNSQLVYKMAHNDSVRVYELASGKEIKTIGFENDNIQGISCSADGQKLLIAADNKLNIWEIESNKLLQTIVVENKGEVTEATFTADGKSILVATDQNLGLKYGLEANAITLQYTGICNLQDKGGITYDPNSYWESHIAKYLRFKNPLVMSKDGKHFFTGKSGTNAKGWNIASGQPEILLGPNPKAVTCFDLSKNGKLLLVGDASGEISIWDIYSGKRLNKFNYHREPIFNVQFSPNEESFISTSWDGSLIVWDIASGKQLSYLNLDNNSAFSSSFTPDGLYIVTGRLNKSLELREPDSKQVVKTFIGHTDIVSSIDFSIEKNKMLTGSWDGTARIWDINTGMMLHKFKGHKGGIQAAIFTQNGSSIITAGDDRIIRIWNVETGKVVQTLQGHQAEITSLDIDINNKLLISYSVDGVVKCWNLETGKEFYEHIHIGEKDWMVRTKEGFFSGTAGARTMVNFVKELEIYSPDQFFDIYYRPDLLPQLFKNRGESGNSNQSIDNHLQKSPPPTIKMFALKNAEGTEAELNVKIIDEGGGVNELKISHNGKVISLDLAKLAFPKNKGEFTIYKQNISLVTGNNVFTGIGISKSKVESQQAKTEVYSNKASHQVVCHLMVVGINKYKNPNLRLNYAREDAQSFADIIQKKGLGLFSKIVTHELYDENATKQRILDTLQNIANQAATHDVFVFYYAGHGSMYDQNFYFIPVDCPHLYNDVNNKGLEANMLQEKFKQIKALKQIIIMDACQSGASVELLAVRGAVEEKAIAQLSRSAGIHVLASAGGEQNAKEIASLKHGLFTYVLLEALSGKADGAPKDGKVTIYELKSYLDDQVPSLNEQFGGKIQFPYTFSKGHDFPIVNE